MGYTRGEAALMWVVVLIIASAAVLGLIFASWQWPSFVWPAALGCGLVIARRVERRQRRGAVTVNEADREESTGI